MAVKAELKSESKKKNSPILEGLGKAESLDNATGSAPVDVRALMAEIRERVKTQVGEAKDQRLPFSPSTSDDTKSDRKAGEILYSEELRYINQHHAYSLSSLRPDSITSHRPIVGPILVKIKRKVLSFFWEGLFKPYFQAEKEFQSNLVRLLNDFAKYTDQRDGFIFWELIRKIDYDVNKALHRIERINDQQQADLLGAEKRVSSSLNTALNQLTELDTAIRSINSRIDSLESVSRGLERIVTRVTGGRNIGKESDNKSTESATAPSESIDYSYLLLENRYRGSESDIAKRLAYYIPYYKDAAAPVLEIGSGRGELQTLFKDNGIDSYGVEMDRAMVEVSREKNLNVTLADGIAHLESLPDKSLGGVIAIQVIEHLTQEQLKRLVNLCISKVVSGGKIIFETINTESMVALARNYFRDPTHVFPLHPETMRFMLELMGLKVVEVNKLSPYSEEASLKEIEVTEFMTPRWAVTVETLNRNIRRLNELLYGHQDYCIVGVVD